MVNCTGTTYLDNFPYAQQFHMGHQKISNRSVCRVTHPSIRFGGLNIQGFFF